VTIVLQLSTVTKINFTSTKKEKTRMKARKYIAFILVFFMFALCACNASDSFDETQTDQTDINLESTDNSSISASETVCGSTNKVYDGIVVRTSIEDYLAQIEKHQSAKLVKYPVDIAAVFAQHGFTEAKEIALVRIKDLEGNYFRSEELYVKYHMPECKDESHSFCQLEFTAYITEPQYPFKAYSYTFIDNVNGLEIYEYDGPYDINNHFKIKIGEFVECTVLIPYDIVGEEKANEILTQIVTIAEKIKKDLTEIAPELITVP
jgi:hypothetical protein